MRISVNGAVRELSAPCPLARLDELRCGAPGEVAVALNGDFVPRAEWPRRLLREDDCVDVVAPVEGG